MNHVATTTAVEMRFYISKNGFNKINYITYLYRLTYLRTVDTCWRYCWQKLDIRYILLKAPVLAAVSEEAGQVDGDVVVVVVGGGVVAQVAQDHHVLAQGEHCHTTNITIKIKIDFENHVVCWQA